MNALDLFKAGRLREALAEQIRVGLASPDDATQRLFWCELLLYCGCLDAVRENLDLLPQDRDGMAEFLADYRCLLDAEQKRQRLFVGEKPMFLLDPPEHVVARCEAIGYLSEWRSTQAANALDVAESHTPFVHGHIDGREFDGVRDGDDHLASVLEVFIGSDYVWVPFEEIRRLRLTAPAQLRDRLFVPAHLRLSNGSEWDVHVPASIPILIVVMWMPSAWARRPIGWSKSMVQSAGLEPG